MPNSSYTYKRGDLWAVLASLGWKLPGPRSGWQTISRGMHEDRRPSCRVNNETGAIACMSCGFRGDLPKLVKEVKGVEYRDAFRIIETVTSGGSDDVSPVGRPGLVVSGSSRDYSGSSRSASSQLTIDNTMIPSFSVAGAIL